MDAAKLKADMFRPIAFAMLRPNDVNTWDHKNEIGLFVMRAPTSARLSIPGYGYLSMP